MPRRAQLAPSLATLKASEDSDGGPAGPDGQTVHTLTSEEVRVKARVDGMLNDEIARQRVEKGVVDHYFGDLKHALEGAVPDPPKFDARPFQGFVTAWARAAKAYATGEDPLASNQASAGLEGADVPGARLQGLGASISHAQSFRRSMENSGSSILAIVEIRQRPNGKLKAITLIESSGYKAFDQYVLRMAPRAIEKFPEPPTRGAGIHADGLRSTWAFIAKTVYKKKVRDIDLKKDWWYFAVAAPLALAGGSFDETTGEVWVTDLHDPKVQCDVRLLGVY